MTLKEDNKERKLHLKTMKRKENYMERKLF